MKKRTAKQHTPKLEGNALILDRQRKRSARLLLKRRRQKSGQ